jgi:hypothetical protein
MGSAANPLFGSPTVPGSGPVYGGGTSTTNNPYMPAIPYSGAPSSTAANPYSSFPAYGSPYGTPGATPQVGTPATGPVGGVAGGGTNPTGIPQAGGPLNPGESNSLNISLGKTYGKGLGGLIEQFLSGGAGYNPQVLQALVAQLQPQFQQQQQNLLGSFSAGGNRFGSGAQTGMASLLSQQDTDVSSMAAQLYEQSVQNYMTVLEDTASQVSGRIVNTPSTFDDIMSGLSEVGNLGSQGAGAYSGLSEAGAI